jgi:hypothetical protein
MSDLLVSDLYCPCSNATGWFFETQYARIIKRNADEYLFHPGSIRMLRGSNK